MTWSTRAPSISPYLKAADLKRLVLYQELVQLKQFERRENVLKAKLDGKMAEKVRSHSSSLTLTYR